LTDAGEIEPASWSIPLLVSVEPDRGDEPRLRTVFTRLALVGEPFSKLNEVDIAPNVGAVTAAEFHEIEATDGAFPKILRAEETGDAVPDLYEALSRRLLKTKPRKGGINSRCHNGPGCMGARR
jgi:hypothetical protein